MSNNLPALFIIVLIFIITLPDRYYDPPFDRPGKPRLRGEVPCPSSNPGLYDSRSHPQKGPVFISIIPLIHPSVKDLLSTYWEAQQPNTTTALNDIE